MSDDEFPQGLSPIDFSLADLLDQEASKDAEGERRGELFHAIYSRLQDLGESFDNVPEDMDIYLYDVAFWQYVEDATQAVQDRLERPLTAAEEESICVDIHTDTRKLAVIDRIALGIYGEENESATERQFPTKLTVQKVVIRDIPREQQELWFQVIEEVLPDQAGMSLDDLRSLTIDEVRAAEQERESAHMYALGKSSRPIMSFIRLHRLDEGRQPALGRVMTSLVYDHAAGGSDVERIRLYLIDHGCTDDAWMQFAEEFFGNHKS